MHAYKIVGDRKNSYNCAVRRDDASFKNEKCGNVKRRASDLQLGGEKMVNWA